MVAAVWCVLALRRAAGDVPVLYRSFDVDGTDTVTGAVPVDQGGDVHSGSVGGIRATRYGLSYAMFDSCTTPALPFNVTFQVMLRRPSTFGLAPPVSVTEVQQFGTIACTSATQPSAWASGFWIGQCGNYALCVVANDSATMAPAVQTQTLDVSRWYAVTVEFTTTQISITVNGKTTTAANQTIVAPGTAPLSLGVSGYDRGPQQFSGWLSGFAIATAGGNTTCNISSNLINQASGDPASAVGLVNSTIANGTAAIEFDFGVTMYQRSFPLYPSVPFNVSLSIYPEPTLTNFNGYLSQGNILCNVDNTTTSGFLFGLTAAYQPCITTYNSSKQHAYCSSFVLALSVWHHFFLEFTASGTNVYINGSLLASTALVATDVGDEVCVGACCYGATAACQFYAGWVANISVVVLVPTPSATITATPTPTASPSPSPTSTATTTRTTRHTTTAIATHTHSFRPAAKRAATHPPPSPPASKLQVVAAIQYVDAISAVPAVIAAIAGGGVSTPLLATNVLAAVGCADGLSLSIRVLRKYPAYDNFLLYSCIVLGFAVVAFIAGFLGYRQFVPSLPLLVSELLMPAVAFNTAAMVRSAALLFALGTGMAVVWVGLLAWQVASLKRTVDSQAVRCLSSQVLPDGRPVASLDPAAAVELTDAAGGGRGRIQTYWFDFRRRAVFSARDRDRQGGYDGYQYHFNNYRVYWFRIMRCLLIVIAIYALGLLPDSDCGKVLPIVMCALMAVLTVATIAARPHCTLYLNIGRVVSDIAAAVTAVMPVLPMPSKLFQYAVCICTAVSIGFAVQSTMAARRYNNFMKVIYSHHYASDSSSFAPLNQPGAVVVPVESPSAPTLGTYDSASFASSYGSSAENLAAYDSDSYSMWPAVA